MRIVTQDMVVLEHAEFLGQASGWFSANTICPLCGEQRQLTVPICDPGQDWTSQVNCNSGHTWTVRAKVVR